MIISDQFHKLDKGYKIVSYKTDKTGKAVPQYDVPPIAGKEKMADVLYQTKYLELIRMKKDVLEGRISPVKLLMDLNNMNYEDIASRLKISKGSMKKHLTPDGFKKVTVEMLEKYATLFDLPISEFFQFITLKKNVKVDFKNYLNKLYCEIDINIKKK